MSNINDLELCDKSYNGGLFGCLLDEESGGRAGGNSRLDGEGLSLGQAFKSFGESSAINPQQMGGLGLGSCNALGAAHSDQNMLG